jgi:hypothetical protein
MNKFKFDTITEAETRDIDRLASVVRNSELYRKYARNDSNGPVPVNVDYRKAVVKFRLTDFAYKVSDNQIKKDVLKLVNIANADAALVLGNRKVFCGPDGDGSITFGIRDNHKPKTLTVSKKCGVWLKPAAEKVIRLASVLAELFRLVDYNTFGITFTQKDASGNVVKTSYEYGVNVPHRHTKSLDFVVFREASRILANITDDGCDYEPFSPDHATIKAYDTGDVYEIDF